jgi:hypothetical protein
MTATAERGKAEFDRLRCLFDAEIDQFFVQVVRLPQF